MGVRPKAHARLGQVEFPGGGIQQRVGDDGVSRAGGEAVVGGAGEGDAGLLADRAVAAVRSDQVPSADPVGALRGSDVEGDGVVVLVQGGQFVPAADLDAQFPGALFEYLLDTRLRNLEGVQRVVGKVAQVQRQATELVEGQRLRMPGTTGEGLVQAAQLQRLDHAADEPVRPGDRAAGVQLLQEQRSHACES